MDRLTLTLACCDYDRTRPLREGTVRAEGADLNVLNLPPEQIFHRMGRSREFDVSEFSLSTFSILRARGEPLMALPVFPSRIFRHSSIYVNPAAAIHAPADLRGKRVGVPKYHMTAAVWIRGLLEEEYGISPKDLLWYEGGEWSHVKDVDVTLPPDIRLSQVPPSQSLEKMVEAGGIDVFLGPRRPAGMSASPQRIRRLFPNAREVEQAYFRKTGIFPIMHVVVLREELARQHPWLPRSLYQAFAQAKQIAYEQLKESGMLPYALPWLAAEVEETFALMGDDPFPYGLARNLNTLDTLGRYVYHQGLASRRLRMDEMFCESTLDT
jgi:4,5-dihydroxyphthalate decarboxylase